MIINKKYVRENYPKGYKYLFSYHILNRVGLASLSDPAPNRENEMSHKQLNIFDTDYESANYTKTSQDALATIKPKIKTKREQVYDLIKLNALTNYEISDELEIPLSSVCARVRELQVLNLVEDSGKRRETKYGKQAIVWQRRK